LSAADVRTRLARATAAASSAILLLVSTIPLAAQDSTAVVPLPAVRVNALRTSMALQRAPLSVAVLGSDRTVDRGPGMAVAEVLGGLAGVQADDRHNQALGERLSIRGFGARSAFGIRGIRVLVDGIPATMPDGQTTLNHVDPARIVGAELVRGPAAAFLGNAAGGVLQLRTGAGGDAGLSAQTGEGRLWRLSGAANLDRTSSYASWQHQQGFRSHSASEHWIMGGVASLPITNGILDGAVHATHYDADNPGSLTAEQVEQDRFQANSNNVRQRTGERGTHAQLGLGWQQQVADDVVLEVRGYAGTRAVFNPIPPRIIDLSRRFGGVRVQASMSGRRYQLAGGGELEAQHDDRQNNINDAGVRGDLVLDQRERVRGAAAFLQAGWTPPGPLRLLGAIRRDSYRFAVSDRLVTASDPDDSGRRTLAATSFTGAGAVELGPGTELFGSVSTAFESPTTTELANQPSGAGGFNPDLQPERTLAGEAGVRAAASSWNVELTGFRADVRDKLVPFEVAGSPGRQFYRNAGRARHQGVELSGALRVNPNLALRAAYARLDVRFQHYLVGGVDYSGRRVPGVAGHRLELEGETRVAGTTRLLVRVLHNGRVPADDGNDASAAPYSLVSVRLGELRLPAGPAALVIYGGLENLLNRGYIAAVTVNAAGARYYEPGPGRSAYLGIRIGAR